MKKIISIVGPTATGKTSFALKVASQALELDDLESTNKDGSSSLNSSKKLLKKYSGVDLISVDSRQVYKGLEILSGADIPNNFELVKSEPSITTDISIITATTKKNVQDFPYFKHKTLDIALHGVSIIDVTQEWSVAHFKNFATKIILNSFKNNRLPILVGGTGLYHGYLFNTDKNLYIPPNFKVREKAQSLSVSELQNWLKKVNSKKLKKMNNSDVNNPRRLVRAIEISTASSKSESSSLKSESNFDYSSIVNLPKDVQIKKYGMDLNLETIKKKIKLRVDERFNSGAVEEVQELLKKQMYSNQDAINNQNTTKTIDLPAFSTLGVSDILKFLNGEFTQEECRENWALHEFQYAKRQLTWFGKKSKLKQSNSSSIPSEIIWLDDSLKKQYTLVDEKTLL